MFNIKHPPAVWSKNELSLFVIYFAFSMFMLESMLTPPQGELGISGEWGGGGGAINLAWGGAIRAV